MEGLKENETYFLQQDKIGSNWWKCSKCKFDCFWGESGEDIKDCDVNYCPKCGRKIKEYVFIEEEEDL